MIAGTGQNDRLANTLQDPYAYVRNPLYLSAGAVFAGMTTMYGLWQRRDAIVLPIIGLLVHLFVVYREEPRTRERLGPVYDTYRATVPRWVPWP